MKILKVLNGMRKFLFDSNYRFLILSSLGKYDNMDDEQYLKKRYKASFKSELDLEAPKTFNEKLQWLKLYDRRPEYTMMVDKYLVREFIAKTIGEEYLIPLLGVWDNPDEIDFDALPEQFVLKCNHNSGLGMCICTDKSKLNINRVKKELRKGLKQDYYLSGREWPYLNVPRKIICEQFISSNDKAPNDYKFFCFNGDVKFFKIDYDRFTCHRANYYDINKKLLSLSEKSFPTDPQRVPEFPRQLDKMISFAKILSREIPFVRVDFYEVDGKVYFGELTFFPSSGFETFVPEEWDYVLGEILTLPNKL